MSRDDFLIGFDASTFMISLQRPIHLDGYSHAPPELSEPATTSILLECAMFVEIRITIVKEMVSLNEMFAARVGHHPIPPSRFRPAVLFFSVNPTSNYKILHYFSEL